MKVVPLLSRSAHAAAALLTAILCLTSSRPARAAQEPIRLLHVVNHGVRLRDAAVPVIDRLGKGLCATAGSQFVLRVRMYSDTADRHVTLKFMAGDRCWSTRVHLIAGACCVPDLMLPVSDLNWDGSTDTPLNRITVSEGKKLLASAELGTRFEFGRARAGGSRYVIIASRQPRRSGMPSLSEDEMTALGSNRACLDWLAAIVAPAPASRWLALPGLASWVRAGGLLLVPGEPRWTEIGYGAVAREPAARLTDASFIGRLALATRNGFILWGDVATRFGAHTSAFSSQPGASAFLESDVPTGALALLLGVYLLILLPGSYVLLRRLRRKEMAWITAPALALAFSMGIAAVCIAFKGCSTAVGRVSVIEEASPGVYLANSYLSIFSPRNSAATVTLPAGSIPEALPSNYFQWRPPRDEFQIYQDADATVVDHLPVLQWTSRSLAYTDSPAIRGAVTGTAFYSSAHGWTASVQNHTSLDLEDCRVWAGDGWLMMGVLPPGGTKTVSGPRRNPTVDYNAPRGRSFEERVRQDELTWLQAPADNNWKGASRAFTRRVFFEGWTHQPVQPATVRGVNSYLDESIIIAHLAIVRGPEGLAAPRSSQSVVSLNTYSDQTGLLLVGSGYSTGGYPAGGYPGGGGGYPGGGGYGGSGYPGSYPSIPDDSSDFEGAAHHSTGDETAAAERDRAYELYGVAAIHLPAAVNPAADTLTFALSRWSSASPPSHGDQLHCLIWNEYAGRWDIGFRLDAHGHSHPKTFSLAHYLSGPPGAVSAVPVLYVKVTGPDSAYLSTEIESQPAARKRAALRPDSEKVIVFLGVS